MTIYHIYNKANKSVCVCWDGSGGVDLKQEREAKCHVFPRLPSPLRQTSRRPQEKSSSQNSIQRNTLEAFQLQPTTT